MEETDSEPPPKTRPVYADKITKGLVPYKGIFSGDTCLAEAPRLYSLDLIPLSKLISYYTEVVHKKPTDDSPQVSDRLVFDVECEDERSVWKAIVKRAVDEDD